MGNVETNLRGGGDATGPSSSTDNAIARFNGTGGKTLQNSTVTISDAGLVAAPLADIGAGANKAQFAADGELTLAGTARVIKEIVKPAGDVQITVGAGYADKETIPIGASGSIVMHVLAFDKTTNEEVNFDFHAPCDIDGSVNASLQVMWRPDPSWTAGAYRLHADYIVQDELQDRTAGAPTTLTQEVTPSNATDSIETNMGAIDIGPDQVVAIRFWREADHGNDLADDDALVEFFELSYTANKLGEAT